MRLISVDSVQLWQCGIDGYRGIVSFGSIYVPSSGVPKKLSSLNLLPSLQRSPALPGQKRQRNKLVERNHVERRNNAGQKMGLLFRNVLMNKKPPESKRTPTMEVERATCSAKILQLNHTSTAFLSTIWCPLEQSDNNLQPTPTRRTLGQLLATCLFQGLPS